MLHFMCWMSRKKRPIQHHVAPHRRCRLFVHVSCETPDATPCHTSPPQGVHTEVPTVPSLFAAAQRRRDAQWPASFAVATRCTSARAPLMQHCNLAVRDELPSGSPDRKIRSDVRVSAIIHACRSCWCTSQACWRQHIET